MIRKRALFSLAVFSFIATAVFFVTARLSGSPNPTDISDKSRAEQRKKIKTKLAGFLLKQRQARERAAAQDRERAARFQSILSTVIGDTNAIVVETAGLKKTRIGEKVFECLTNTHSSELSRAKQKFGVDVLTDSRRVAFARRFVLFDGWVTGIENGTLFNDAPQSNYGVYGKIFSSESASDTATPRGGIWSNELLVVSEDQDEIHDVIDIAEGRDVNVGQPLGFKPSNGLIYGTMQADKLVDLLGVSKHLGDSASLLNRVVQSIFFEVFVYRDVLIRAELTLHNPTFKKLLVSGLEAIRTALADKSVSLGHDELAALIDKVSLLEHGDTIQLELEMPIQFLERELTRCTE